MSEPATDSLRIDTPPDKVREVEAALASTDLGDTFTTVNLFSDHHVDRVSVYATTPPVPLLSLAFPANKSARLQDALRRFLAEAAAIHAD